MTDQQGNVQSNHMPVVIIGAGQAGVALSYYLQQKNIEHKLLEKHEPFHAWRQRWDAFYMNTANWMNVLPGLEQAFVPGEKDGGLASKSQALDYFQRYLQMVKPPVETGVEVTSVEPLPNGQWSVTAGENKLICHNVVICTGTHNTPYIPSLGAQLPSKVSQLHSSRYCNPRQIQTANVLIVGSGSSGVQIAADIAGSGRIQGVTLSMGRNRRFPWTVLGLSVHTIARVTRLFNIRRDTWLGKMFYRRMPLSDPAAPPSPAMLQRMGVRIKSKVTTTNSNKVIFEDGSDMALDDLTVIWCTGYRPKWPFLAAEVKRKILQDNGYPRHSRGVVDTAPGLYFLGLRFQYTLGSHILLGIGRDADYIAQHINQRFK